MWPIGMRMFPLGLGGLMANICPVCKERYRTVEQNVNIKTGSIGRKRYLHDGDDFCMEK